MSDKKSSNLIGCLFVGIGIIVMLLICRPIIDALGDGAYPIVMIGGILLAIAISKAFKR